MLDRPRLDDSYSGTSVRIALVAAAGGGYLGNQILSGTYKGFQTLLAATGAMAAFVFAGRLIVEDWRAGAPGEIRVGRDSIVVKEYRDFAQPLRFERSNISAVFIAPLPSWNPDEWPGSLSRLKTFRFGPRQHEPNLVIVFRAPVAIPEGLPQSFEALACHAKRTRAAQRGFASYPEWLARNPGTFGTRGQ